MEDYGEFYPSIDSGDEDRIVSMWVEKRWFGQDGWLRPYIRQVEDNLRMIAGRHWDVWLETEGRFVDVTEWMTEEEIRWRQRPVFNWSGYWYQITHAKLTENGPVLSFLPATEDRIDALLAAVMDPVFKYLWDVVGMDDKVSLFMRWVVAAGRGIFKSYWDVNAGETIPLIAPAAVPVLDENGQPYMTSQGLPMQEVVDEVPYQLTEDGDDVVPLVQALPGGNYQITGKPSMVRKGQLNVDVLSPLELRSSADPVPFREKRWHVQRSVMHVDEIREKFGVTVEPDVQDDREATLNQILFGLGNQGASSQRMSGDGDLTDRMDGFSAVYEGWEEPREGAEEGRRTICTATKLLDDDVKPYEPKFRPYQAADFIMLADRPFGKSPMEDIAPINRTYDRGWGQILEHRNLMTNPFWVKDSLSGIGDITNAPGQVITALMRPGVEPIKAVQPPQLPNVVYDIQMMLKEEMKDIGALRSGSEGRPPTTDASGELVKELRYNDDRSVGDPAKAAVRAIANMVYEWQPILREHWTDEEMIRVSGEQNVSRFIMVRPEMFQGRVNVKPVVESMLPEGRGEKQRRLDFWLSAQVITPERYLELYNHPHMGRAAKPGGVHGEMAEWENGQLMQGNLLYPIEPHDDEIHLLIHETFMAAPEFLELGPEVRTLFYNHVDAHRNLIQQKALRDAALMAQVAGPAGQMESMAQVQATAPLALAAGAENEGNSEEADTG